MMKMGVN